MTPMSKSVLLMDREHAARDRVATHLRRMGWDVVDVSEMEHAAAQLAARRFDAMVFDVKVPGSTGLLMTTLESIPLCRSAS